MESFRPALLVVALVVSSLGIAFAQEEPAEETKPSAELIIDAEETIIQEPALAPGEEPLPRMDGGLPGEQNIFGTDLFGTGTGIYAPRSAQVPARVPLLEDPQEAERKMRIRLRKIKAGLDRDPRLVELKEIAATAPTPEDYRAARRAYYTVFFDKVRRADASLKNYADKLEKESLAGLYQSRVEPTWPLQPPPMPQPPAKFVPVPEYPQELPADEQPVALP
jgi:hypothetical protein